LARVVELSFELTDEFGNDSIGIRSMMYLPISYDHRLIDGAYAADGVYAMVDGC